MRNKLTFFQKISKFYVEIFWNSKQKIIIHSMNKISRWIFAEKRGEGRDSENPNMIRLYEVFMNLAEKYLMRNGSLVEIPLIAFGWPWMNNIKPSNIFAQFFPSPPSPLPPFPSSFFITQNTFIRFNDSFIWRY